VTYDNPAVGLLEEAEAYDLVVLGRHRSVLPIVHRLGSVAQRVLHAGVIPIMVVPTSHS
jgi:nucleotide-binding universal stress UspA family protein